MRGEEGAVHRPLRKGSMPDDVQERLGAGAALEWVFTKGGWQDQRQPFACVTQAPDGWGD